jgi:hypothetical protein
MKENNDNTEQEQKPEIVKILNREFDVSTPEGKAQLQGFTEALAVSAGKNAQEKDEFQKKYESLSQQYSFKSESVDFQEAKQKVAQMREEGVSEEQIDNYWLTFSQLSAKAASKGNDYDVFWAEYKGKRPELFASLTKMEQDMYKKHIQETYLNQLQTAENPLVFMDQLFEDKVRSLNAKKPLEVSEPEDKVPASLSKSRQARPLTNFNTKELNPDEIDEKEKQKTLELMAEFSKSLV